MSKSLPGIETLDLWSSSRCILCFCSQQMVEHIPILYELIFVICEQNRQISWGVEHVICNTKEGACLSRVFLSRLEELSDSEIAHLYIKGPTFYDFFFRLKPLFRSWYVQFTEKHSIYHQIPLILGKKRLLKNRYSFSTILLCKLLKAK